MRTTKLVFLFLVAVAVLTFVGNAQAVPIVAGVTHVKLFEGPGTIGGEFYVDVLGAGVSTSPYVLRDVAK